MNWQSRAEIESLMREQEGELIGGIRVVLEEMEKHGKVITYDLVVGVTSGYMNQFARGNAYGSAMYEAMAEFPGFVKFHYERIFRVADEVMEIITKEK